MRLLGRGCRAQLPKPHFCLCLVILTAPSLQS